MWQARRIKSRSAAVGVWLGLAGVGAAFAQDPSAGPSGGGVRPAGPPAAATGAAAVAPVVPGQPVAAPAGTPGGVVVPPGTPGAVAAPAGTVVLPPTAPGTPASTAAPGAGAAAAVPAASAPGAGGEAGAVVVPRGTPGAVAAPAGTEVVPPEEPGPPAVAPGAAAAAAATEPAAPAKSATPVRTNVGRAALDSIFGKTDYREWTPLPLSTVFSEGWDEAWVGPPNGDRGGPRQGWIGAADGNFYRLAFFSYAYTNRLAQGGDGNVGGFTYYTPLSRRLELITQVPFVVSNQSTFAIGKQAFPNQTGSGAGAGAGAANHGGRGTPTGFGDMSFTPRVMLAESRNFSLTGEVTVQVPTGYRPTGSGQSIVTPGLAFWSNFAEGWVIRGGFNTGVGTNPQAGGTTLVSQLAVGRTWTKHEVPIFGDFTTYLSTNVFNALQSAATTATLTPGFRTHLGKSYYFLGGLDVPVTGKRPYEESVTFWFMKVF